MISPVEPSQLSIPGEKEGKVLEISSLDRDLTDIEDSLSFEFVRYLVCISDKLVRKLFAARFKHFRRVHSLISCGENFMLIDVRFTSNLVKDSSH